MRDIFLRFIKTRDWLNIFMRFSTSMFWFYLLIGISIVIFQPFREVFLDWIVQHNKEYFIEYLNWLFKHGYAEPISPENNQPNIQTL